MRVLILSQWFDPEPTLKGLHFAAELKKLGHSVEVLTGFPNYPGGRVYPGYRIKLYQRETLSDIPVVRVALYPCHNASALGRALNYCSFAFFSSVLGPFLVARPDVIYVYHPPATAALAAIVFRLLFGVPFVQDIQDLWPDSLTSTGMVRSHALLVPIRRWCEYVYRKASHICVLSSGFKTCLIDRGVPPLKVSVIPNWADDSLTDRNDVGVENSASDDPKKFIVTFAGTMGKAQALEAVLLAAKILETDNPRVRIIFIGGGIEKNSLQIFAHNLRLNNVTFLERRPSGEIGGVLRASDVLLVHLKKDPLFEITIPSKIQAYLAIGRPILVAVPGDASRIVEAAGAGISCTPEDPESIAAAIDSLSRRSKDELDELGKNGRAYYRDKLSLPAGVRQFDEIFRRLRKAHIVQDCLQRLFDIVFSLLGLIALFPVIVLTAFFVKVKLGTPIFFRQVRPGLHGQPFFILKFRTMTDARDESGNLLPDSARLTTAGKFIRRFSLDELPQLWNVIRGDLSLVGPRPLLMSYLPRYTLEQARRQDVKPGVTGWAQVNGRNAITWDERFALDNEYIDKKSIGLYFKILALTVLRLFRSEGISHEHSATMPEFLGRSSIET